MSGIPPQISGTESGHSSILSRLFARPLPNESSATGTNSGHCGQLADTVGLYSNESTTVCEPAANDCLYSQTGNQCDETLSDLPDVSCVKQEKTDSCEEGLAFPVCVQEVGNCPLEDDLEPSVSGNMMVNDYETRRNSFDEYGRRMSFSLDKKAPILASIFRISKRMASKRKENETSVNDAGSILDNINTYMTPAGSDGGHVEGMMHPASCSGSSVSPLSNGFPDSQTQPEMESYVNNNNNVSCDNNMEIMDVDMEEPKDYNKGYLWDGKLEDAPRNEVVSSLNISAEEKMDEKDHAFQKGSNSETVLQENESIDDPVSPENYVEAFPMSNVTFSRLISEEVIDASAIWDKYKVDVDDQNLKCSKDPSNNATTTTTTTFDSPLSVISECDSSISVRSTHLAEGSRPRNLSINKSSIRWSCSENSGYGSGYSSDFCTKDGDYGGGGDGMMASRCDSRDSSVNRDDFDVTSPSTVSSPASYCSSSYSDYNSLSDTMFIPSPGSASQLPINGDVMWSSPQPQNQLQVKVEHTAEASTTTHSPSLQNAHKKKRLASAGKTLDEELCLICGDRASGYHYNALSCEGCKGFFRRSITRAAAYSCKYGGHCEMDMWMRRKCQSCRLRRCREVGMKEECLLSEEQCKARDVRRKQRQRVPKPHTPDSSQPSPQPQQDVKPVLEGGPVKDPLNYMSTEDKQVIEKIVVYQDRFELPSDDDVKNIAEVKISDLGRPKEMSEQIYKNMAEMTILVTQLVVEYAKHLPGFSEISREDQIALLKGSASEVMMLRTSRRYDIETDTIIFGNGVPMTRDSLRFGGLQDYVDSMFVFCRGMADLGVDNAEYALLTAICILSDRPGLSQSHKCEALQEQYLKTFISYEFWRRPRSEHYLAKLLMKLTDLRTLSHEHAGILFALKVEKGSLPPLVTEYFDVVEQSAEES